jgi:thioesterase domain-containing protein/acyl carrier protein
MAPLETSQINASTAVINKDNHQSAVATQKAASSEAAKKDLWEAIRTIIGLQNQAPPLLPVDRNHPLSLSFTQERLWFLEQLGASGSAYNIPFAFRLQGNLNFAALEQSLNALLQRHEALRTTFTAAANQPFQVIAPPLTLTLNKVDVPVDSPTGQDSQVQHYVRQDAQTPFDLTQGPLLRATLLQLTETEHVLLLTVHHIIFDGWSEGVLWRELAAFYEAFSAGESAPLPDLPIQYGDFAVWQRQWLQGDFFQALIDYWKAELGDGLEELQIPIDYPRPALQTRQSTCQQITLSEELTTALKKLSRQAGATLFATLLSAFKVLLHRYTTQEDVFVCTPIANRNRKELQGLIGYFVNLLILRTDLSGNPDFRTLMGRVRQGVSGAYAHQDLPVQQVVSQLNLSQTALSKVMFVLQNTPGQVPQLSGLTVTSLDTDNGIADFDLFFSLTEDAGTLTGALKYNTDLFDAVTITRMLQHFQAVLEQVVENPESPITDLLPLSDEEQQQLEAGRLRAQLRAEMAGVRSQTSSPLIKPRDALELQLTKIWSDVLGRSDLGVTDNFFELGGESLIAMRLFAQIEAHLGKTLPLATLIQAPTVEQLANILRQDGWSPPSASLVTLRAGDVSTKLPLFLIAPGAYTALHYLELVNLLDPEQPVYGLQARGLETDQEPHDCIEDMAAHYIQEIETLNFEGPYLLGGRCGLGSTVAFEMAQQLKAQGKDVKLVAMIDPTWNAFRRFFQASQPAEKSLGYYWGRLVYHWQHNQLFERLFLKLGVKPKPSQPAGVDQEQEVVPAHTRRVKTIEAIHKRAMLNYLPQVYAGKITLFQDEERSHMPVYQSWTALATDGLERHKIPGKHQHMLEEPNIQVLASKLQACLDHLQAD